MNKKIKALILALICVAFLLILIGCSCGGDDTVDSLPDSTNGSTPNSTPDSDNESIGTPPLVDDKNHTHYWHNISIEPNPTSTMGIIIKGVCYECGDKLSKEANASVNEKEWKTALSSESLKSFTIISEQIADGKVASVSYKDLDESGARHWQVKNGTYTEEYFIRSSSENSKKYSQLLSGFALSYNNFKYDVETRSYIYKINDTSSVVLRFADKELFFHSSGENLNTYYVNHHTIEISTPSYFSDLYKDAISLEGLKSSNLGESMASKVYSFLNKLTFDGSFEYALLDDGVFSVYFTYDEPRSEDIFNSYYTSASVVAKDGKLIAVSIGDSTLEIEYEE